MSEQLDLDAIEAVARAQARYASTIDSTHVSIPLLDVLALVAALRKAWEQLERAENTLSVIKRSAYFTSEETAYNNIQLINRVGASYFAEDAPTIDASGGEPGGGG